MSVVPFPPPEKLSVIHADLASRELTFSWSPVAPDCPAVHYNILASNCGTCSTITSYTTITCANVPTDGSTCILAVQTVVCGNVTGNFSDSVRGTLKGTRIPQPRPQATDACRNYLVPGHGKQIFIHCTLSLMLQPIFVKLEAKDASTTRALPWQAQACRHLCPGPQ